MNLLVIVVVVVVAGGCGGLWVVLDDCGWLR